MPIVVKFNKKDYKAEVTPSDTVESIRNSLKLARVEFYYCGSQLALKDTMEIARITSGSILNVKLPRLRESRSVPLAQWRLTTEHTSRSHTLQRIAKAKSSVKAKAKVQRAEDHGRGYENEIIKRRLSIKKEDVKRFGMTALCGGGMAVWNYRKVGSVGKEKHSERCRKRVSEELGKVGDERITLQKERLEEGRPGRDDEDDECDEQVALLGSCLQAVSSKPIAPKPARFQAASFSAGNKADAEDACNITSAKGAIADAEVVAACTSAEALAKVQGVATHTCASGHTHAAHSATDVRVNIPFHAQQKRSSSFVKKESKKISHASLQAHIEQQAQLFVALIDDPDSWDDLLASPTSMQSTLAGAKGMEQAVGVAISQFISAYTSVLEDSVRCTVSMTADWLTCVNATGVVWTDTREVMLALKEIVSIAGTIELAQGLEDSTKFYELVNDLIVIAARHFRDSTDVPCLPFFASLLFTLSDPQPRCDANLVRFMTLLEFTPHIFEKIISQNVGEWEQFLTSDLEIPLGDMIKHLKMCESWIH